MTSSPVGSSSERVRRALTLWMVARTSSKGASTAVGDLLDGGRAAELVGQLVARLGHAQLQLLQAARDAHGPRLVAEVALDLAQHRRRRVGGEAHLAREVEAVDRLHDPDAGDLHEVVERLAAVGVAPGERPGERQHLLGQLVARARVALLVNAAQKLLLSQGARGGGDGLPLVHAIAGQRAYPLVEVMRGGERPLVGAWGAPRRPPSAFSRRKVQRLPSRSRVADLVVEPRSVGDLPGQRLVLHAAPRGPGRARRARRRCVIASLIAPLLVGVQRVAQRRAHGLVDGRLPRRLSVGRAAPRRRRRGGRRRRAARRSPGRCRAARRRSPPAAARARAASRRTRPSARGRGPGAGARPRAEASAPQAPSATASFQASR